MPCKFSGTTCLLFFVALFANVIKMFPRLQLLIQLTTRALCRTALAVSDKLIITCQVPFLYTSAAKPKKSIHTLTLIFKTATPFKKTNLLRKFLHAFNAASLGNSRMKQPINATPTDFEL